MRKGCPGPVSDSRPHGAKLPSTSQASAPATSRPPVCLRVLPRVILEAQSRRRATCR